MKSPYSFVISPKGGVRYNNTSKHGDGKLITSSSIEDFKTANRFGVVKELPIVKEYSSKIKIGDIVVVHHNIFKKYYDMKGREMSGPCHFKDDLYIVDIDQMYLFHDGKKWNPIGDYCFVRPLEKDKEVILTNQKNKELTGELVYGNPKLTELGVKVGDEVCFTPESEYEFEIETETLYRMKTKDICVLI